MVSLTSVISIFIVVVFYFSDKHFVTHMMTYGRLVVRDAPDPKPMYQSGPHTLKDFHRGHVWRGISESSALGKEAIFVLLYAPWDVDSAHAFKLMKKLMKCEPNLYIAAINCWSSNVDNECSKNFKNYIVNGAFSLDESHLISRDVDFSYPSLVYHYPGSGHVSYRGILDVHSVRRFVTRVSNLFITIRSLQQFLDILDENFGNAILYRGSFRRNQSTSNLPAQFLTVVTSYVRYLHDMNHRFGMLCVVVDPDLYEQIVQYFDITKDRGELGEEEGVMFIFKKYKTFKIRLGRSVSTDDILNQMYLLRNESVDTSFWLNDPLGVVKTFNLWNSTSLLIFTPSLSSNAYDLFLYFIKLFHSEYIKYCFSDKNEQMSIQNNLYKKRMGSFQQKLASTLLASCYVSVLGKLSGITSNHWKTRLIDPVTYTCCQSQLTYEDCVIIQQIHDYSTKRQSTYFTQNLFEICQNSTNIDTSSPLTFVLANKEKHPHLFSKMTRNGNHDDTPLAVLVNGQEESISHSNVHNIVESLKYLVTSHHKDHVEADHIDMKSRSDRVLRRDSPIKNGSDDNGRISRLDGNLQLHKDVFSKDYKVKLVLVVSNGFSSSESRPSSSSSCIFCKRSYLILHKIQYILRIIRRNGDINFGVMNSEDLPAHLRPPKVPTFILHVSSEADSLFYFPDDASITLENVMKFVMANLVDRHPLLTWKMKCLFNSLSAESSAEVYWFKVWNQLRVLYASSVIFANEKESLSISLKMKSLIDELTAMSNKD